MDDTPVVLGINRDRHASVCLMHGARVQWAIQKERLTRRRRHEGTAGDMDAIYLPRLPGLERPLDVLVECHSHGESTLDGGMAGGDESTLVFAHGARRARISRHMAQVYSAFHPSPFREAAVMVLGGQGSMGPDHGRTVASCYRVDRERIACIGQQAAGDGERHAAGIGMFYSRLTRTLFPGEGNEGKVADLAPYGDPYALGLPPLDIEDMQVRVPHAWQSLLDQAARFRFGAPQASFTDCANLAAAGQRTFEEALLALAHAVLEYVRSSAGGGVEVDLLRDRQLVAFFTAEKGEALG